MTHPAVETLHMVTVSKLNLNEDLYDTLADFYEIRNGSICKYFPNTKIDSYQEQYGKIKQAHKDAINEALVKCGIDLANQEEYFTVLLYFTW